MREEKRTRDLRDGERGEGVKEREGINMREERGTRRKTRQEVGGEKDRGRE